MRGLIVGMVVLLPPMAAGQDARGTPREQYEALVAEFKANMDGWNRVFSRADDRNAPEAAIEARYREWPGWSFAPRFVDLAELHPKEEMAIGALSQVIVEIGRSVGQSDILLVPHYERAVALLIRDHLDDDRLKEICRMVAKLHAPACETLLRTAMEKSRNRDVRGVACLGLSAYLANKAQIAAKPWFEDKEQMKDPFARFIASRCDPAYLRYVRESRPMEARAESRLLRKRALNDYRDVVYWQDPNDPGRRETIGESARPRPDDLPAEVGGPAPEIEGKDLDSKPMKLSDYRGKVVVLGFWGSASPPSMAMVRRERALADRMKDKPVVLLGVNGDEDHRQAVNAVRQEKITWRSWMDGKPGTIAARWDVDSGPMLYILDARGVVRYGSAKLGEDGDFGGEFERALAEALKEAGEAKQPSP